MAFTEIWSVERMGSKLSASASPDGTEVAIGITNMLARTGVSNRINRDQARALAAALIAFAEGGRG